MAAAAIQLHEGARRSVGLARREWLKRDVIADHEGFRIELGVAMARDSLATIGIRK